MVIAAVESTTSLFSFTTNQFPLLESMTVQLIAQKVKLQHFSLIRNYDASTTHAWNSCAGVNSCFDLCHSHTTKQSHSMH